MRRRAVVLSGRGRTGDPWHRFDQTTACLAQVLRDAGLRVEVRPADRPEAFCRLDAVELLVLNTGTGPDPEQQPAPGEAWQQAHHELGAWLDGGGALLACHTAVASLRDWEQWPARLGGRWVRGTSGHPPLAVSVFQPAPGALEHPLLAGIDRIDGVTPDGEPVAAVVALDEKYTDLELQPHARPVLGHLAGERFQVMGWTVGSSTVYDGMGHDERSFASPSRRRYLRNEVDWLLG